ncbi:MAG: DNA repair protein RecN [Betaproteobacteria bacterium]|nr:DNA repair protein RecN [Betaproteobacteria bacterium]MDE2211543.1 DNA repair protein RecN [Betaproteobacteria bacterium]
MLRALSIRNFVIVEALDLEFEPGFTVLTGETGAGKSILIEALSLALGARAESGSVRAGAQRAEVVAEFQIPDGNPALQWLQDNDLQSDDAACVLRRVVDLSGKSRAFINGSSVPVQQLKTLSEWLLDIHGQHAHQSLQKSVTQRALLDAFAGTADLAQTVRTAFNRWQQARQTWEEWQTRSEALLEEKARLRDDVRELETLDLGPGSWEALQAEQARLAHAASLQEGAQFALDTLAEADDAVQARLQAVADRLGSLTEFDSSLQPGTDLVESAKIQLDEAVHALRRYAMGMETDEEGLGRVESRMQAVLAAARRHRVRPEALHTHLEALAARLETLEATGSGTALKTAADAAETDFRRQAEALSERRTAAAAVLGQTITDTMGQLAMGNGVFEIVLAPLERATAAGLDEVEFRVSAHASRAPEPLARVASGGELSRISLAIQAALMAVTSVPTLIFDEVDTGIGGRVAEIVGRLLEGLGARHQVICVTHLPQVAARGHHHLSVTKTEQEGGVNSTIQVLSREARIEELARMLGGVTITPTTRRHAAEMLSH